MSLAEFLPEWMLRVVAWWLWLEYVALPLVGLGLAVFLVGVALTAATRRSRP
jgi:hypothetical protein